MAQTTFIPRYKQDIDAGNLTVTTLTINGTEILATSILLGSGELVDLNGEADALIFDALQAVRMDGSTAGHLKIKISGAYDFDITANTLTALSGSSIATNTIVETTSGSGVTIDSVLLKDGGAVFGDGATMEIDTIDEATSGAGVTIELVKIEDGGVILADSAVLEVDTINEAASAAGVTVDGVLIKDGMVGVIQAITGDGAITVQNSVVVLSKGSPGAITIVAPTAGAHDGKVIEIIAISAQAHVVTSSVDGFNAKGASGTLTFGGAIGDSCRIRAHNGHWYTVALNNVVPA